MIPCYIQQVVLMLEQVQNTIQLRSGETVSGATLAAKSEEY